MGFIIIYCYTGFTCNNNNNNNNNDNNNNKNTTKTPARNTHFKTLQIIRIYRLLSKFLPRKAFGRYVHGKGAKRK